MKQRFYIRNYGDDRWYVFMGNEAMAEIGGGLKVADVGYKEAAETVVRQYTQQFNDMVASEDLTITESL